MPRSEEEKRSFSLLVLAVLLTQLFLPFAFAGHQQTAATAPNPYAKIEFQGAASTAIAGCELKELNAAQARRLLDSVFMFEGKEITDRPDASLRATPAGGGQNLTVNVYNFPVEESTRLITVREFVQLAARGGKSESQVLKEVNDALGLNESDELTVAQARAFATNNKYSPNLQAQLSSFISGARGRQIEAPGFEAMKIRLPNGVEQPLSELLKVPEIKRRFGEEKSCILTNANFKGKISYRGLLDRDLLIAADRAPSNLDFPQHISTDKGYAASLTNYDGNIVIPYFYEKALAAIKKWSYIDFLVSSVTAIYAIKSVASAEKEIKKADEKIEELKKTASAFDNSKVPVALQEPFFVSANGRELRSKFQAAKIAAIENPKDIAKQTMEFPQNVEDLLRTRLRGDPQIDAKIAKIKTEFAAKGSADEQLNFLESAKIPGTTTGETLAPQGISKYIKEESEPIISSRELAKQKPDEELLKQTERIASVRAWNSAMLGLLWLGPARFGLELSDALVFSSRTSPDKQIGDRVIVYVNNNQFADEFKRGSDWLLTGRILQFISDLTGSGIPSKVFNVDKVQLIQAMGETGKEKLSATTITQEPGGNWAIFTNWQGKSEATAFEDVRDGKQTSSMALEVNNSAWNVGLKRKKEFTQYYHVIVALGPILAFKSYLGDEISSGLISLVRLAVLDIYLENFIDPVKFSEKEKCSQKELDWYLNLYKGAIALGQAEQLIFFTPVGESFKLLSGFKNLLLGIPKAEQAASFYSKVAIVDPIGMGKAAVGSLALEYTSTCKDSQYKILTYQKLPEKVKASTLAKVKDRAAGTVGLDQILKGLNIGKSFETFVGNQLKASELKEILNFKALLDDQGGQVRPAELYDLHMQPETRLSRTAPYEEGCFRNCLVNKDGKFICLDGQRGVYDSNGTQIADRDFALNSFFIPRLGNVVPTKLVIAPLACGPRPFIEARAQDGSATLVDSACSATDCLKTKLFQLTGFGGINALSHDNWFGKLKSVHTTLGVGQVHAGEFRFTYKTGVAVERTLTGSVVDWIPFVNPPPQGITNQTDNQSGLTTTQRGLTGTERRFTSIEVLGDANVRVAGSTKQEDGLGEMLTLEFDKGMIHYDRAGRRLVAVIHFFVELPASSIQTLGASPASVASPRAELQKESQELAELKRRLEAGQALSDKQLDLLKRMLEKLPGRDQFTPKQLDDLREALRKRAAGQPITPAERDLINRAQQLPIFPGVTVLPQSQIDKAAQAMKDGGASQAKTDEIKQKLEQRTPLTLEDKKEATRTIDAAERAGKISPTEARDLRQAISDATAPAERAREIAENLAAGRPVEAQQRQAVLNAVTQEQARVASDISSAPATDIPGIKLGPVVAKPGQEENAINLNRALDKLGTLTDFKTEKHLISFGADQQGNAVVRIGDKEKGTFETLKLTGPATRDGNSIIFPTEKGPLKFDFSMNPTTGAPTINIEGPGIRENSPLILAQGKDGFMWFDPTTGTWRVGPGIVIPTDELFGRTGAQFQGSPDGTRGVAADDRFTPPSRSREVEIGSPSSPLLSLPSWPENNFAIVATMLFILAGALVTRVLRRREGNA